MKKNNKGGREENSINNKNSNKDAGKKGKSKKI